MLWFCTIFLYFIRTTDKVHKTTGSQYTYQSLWNNFFGYKEIGEMLFINIRGVEINNEQLFFVDRVMNGVEMGIELFGHHIQLTILL
jgi:hypothetical protein